MSAEDFEGLTISDGEGDDGFVIEEVDPEVERIVEEATPEFFQAPSYEEWKERFPPKDGYRWVGLADAPQGGDDADYWLEIPEEGTLQDVVAGILSYTKEQDYDQPLFLVGPKQFLTGKQSLAELGVPSGNTITLIDSGVEVTEENHEAVDVSELPEIPKPRAYFPGMTELHDAIQLRDVDRVKKVLEEHPEQANQKGESGSLETHPIVIAIAYGGPEIVKILLEAGSRPEKRAAFAIVMEASLNESGKDILKALVEADAIDLEEPCPTMDVQPLGAAVGLDKPEIVECLLELKADPNGMRGDHPMPLTFLALYSEAPKVLEVLLKSKADAKVVHEDMTALGLAVGMSQTEAAQLLLEAGADPQAEDVRKALETVKESGEDAGVELAELIERHSQA